MIKYDLICDKGHEFDGWFRDSAAFEKQSKRRLISCTVCGSDEVTKQLMAPGIPVKSNRKPETSQTMLAGAVDTRTQKLMQIMREVRKNIEANAEYVGDRFADEARKIHYAESEKRGIYGEAKLEDAQALIDEGIEVHPLPRLPEDSN
jgi:hypothetical protein